MNVMIIKWGEWRNSRYPSLLSTQHFLTHAGGLKAWDYLIAICLAMLICMNSFGQPKPRQFRHLSIDEGLSSSRVISILQDHKGFMWLGTYDGLNRYDGANMVMYKNVPTDSSSIPENHVRTIFEDHNKQLFIGTWEGLSMYNRDLDQFLNYKFDKSSALFDLKISVFRIVEDSTGNLWLATTNGLIYFDRQNNKATQYKNDPNDPTSISSNAMDCVFIDKRGRLWIATRKGLNLFDKKTGNFNLIIHAGSDNENIADKSFLDIKEDHMGNIWFGSNDGLFYLEYKEDITDITLIHYKSNPQVKNTLSNNNIRSLFIDDEGNLLIGTENGGLNLYDIKKKSFTHYQKNEYDPMSLNNESIWAIAYDRNKNLWVGTFGGGVNLSIKNSDFIFHYKNLPGATESLSHNIVSCFLEDHYNRKWIGTDGGGLNLFNVKTSRFECFNSNNSKLSSNAILCMTEGDNQQIWMGTWSGGLASFNYETKQVKSFTTSNSGIHSNNIVSIDKDQSGNLWLASNGFGLINYQLKEDRFITYNTRRSAILGNEITVVKTDNKGRIHFGTNNGFQILTPSLNHFQSFLNNPATTNKQKNNIVQDILIESDTIDWVATQNGLFRVNTATGNFSNFSVTDGLPDNSIRALTADKKGLLWLSTTNGICRFDYQRNLMKIFNKSDGLQSNEFFGRSILTTNNGDILAGGTNGFNLISPRKVPVNKTIPEIVITDFHIFNKKLQLGAKDSPLKKQISETKEITLSYKHSVLTFYFAALDYTNPKKNQYAYMMENFDKGWTYCGNRMNTTYTNLNPGKYIFRVKGSNNDEVWNEEGTTIIITITPPWWKTKIAIVSFILFLFCLFMGVYYFRVNQLKAQKMLLEKLVVERTQEIEEQDEKLKIANNQLTQLNATKDQFFSILAHDLRNPFNSILGFTEILNNNERSIDENEVRIINQQLYTSASSTYNLLENLLEWSRSQSNRIAFKPQQLDLESIFKEVTEGLNSNTKNITINYLPTQKIIIFADVNMIKTVLRNLLSNAIKFTHKNGKVTVDACDIDGEVTITVSDNGTGIKKEDIDKLFDFTQKFSSNGTAQEKGTGLGLIICSEFVEKHGGKIWVESDPENHRGKKGSDFKFTIPSKR
jgi:ligand-binding sensor domain-containing protein/signal transduction histidine kinase